MNTKEFLDKLNVDQLHYAIEYAEECIQKLIAVPRKEYWCLGDSWMNVAFFIKEDRQRALALFVEEFESDTSYSELRLELVHRRPDEVEGLLK